MKKFIFCERHVIRKIFCMLLLKISRQINCPNDQHNVLTMFPLNSEEVVKKNYKKKEKNLKPDILGHYFWWRERDATSILYYGTASYRTPCTRSYNSDNLLRIFLWWHILYKDGGRPIIYICWLRLKWFQSNRT